MKSYFSKDKRGFFDGSISFIHASTAETVKYALNAYGFLIPYGETLTPSQFADKIKAVYDCENCPQNKAVIDELDKLL